MELVPISSLQHWLFCQRQCALIHVERLWEENVWTAEGRILHEKVDAGSSEIVDGVRVLRSVHIGSNVHGLVGIADVVELRKEQPYLVEYKRGRPKAHRADEVQLCAQALCLEEMTGKPIKEGALFYGAKRRRTVVSIDPSLRSLTVRVASEVRQALEEGSLPEPLYEPRRCDTCSLYELCRPKSSRKLGAFWLSKRMARTAVPE